MVPFLLVLVAINEILSLRTIPADFLDSFTLGGLIPVQDNYHNDRISEPVKYSKVKVDSYMGIIRQRTNSYYGETDTWVYNAIEDFPAWINGKLVGVLGSTKPFYESVVLHYRGRPITIDYNEIRSDDPRITIMTVEEYKRNPIKFDSILSISTFEHDGLGRYGDPINPFGDIRAMKEAKEMLKPGGLLFLAVPVGKDLLAWNAHRIYGPIRLPLLLSGWEIVAQYGFNAEEDFQRESHEFIQPVFVLRSASENVVEI